MAHGTLSSVQINLDDPAYAYAKNNPYIVGLLNAGWRWGDAGHTDGNETEVIHYSVEGNWSVDQRIVLAGAFATWENVANIDIQFTSNNDAAEILVHHTTTATIAHFSGWSGTPNQATMEDNNTTQPDNDNPKTVLPSTFQNADLGRVDVWIPFDADDFTTAPSSTNWGLNSAAWIDIIHEIGHALGLKHPHDHGTINKPSSTADQNNAAIYPPRYPGITDTEKKPQNNAGTDGYNVNINTIMSYVHPDPTFKKFPGSPMAFDIAAMQVLYGANTTYNSGDNTYTILDPAFQHDSDEWGQAGKEFQGIWDTGGTDQIVYNGSRVAVIDLRPATLTTLHRAGYFSYLDGKHISAGFVIAGDITNALTDVNGVTGVIIENATGGLNDDQIWGNGVNNVLHGNGGADTLRGAGGNDTLYGDAGKDTLLGGLGDDTYALLELAGGKYDTASELGGGGDDTVWVQQFALVGPDSYTLTKGVERGILFGTGNGFTLTGNDLDNHLQGSDYNDRLVGKDGNDTLNGLHGFDVLLGGFGNDTYILNYVDITSFEQYSSVVEGFRAGTDTVEVRKDPNSSFTSYALTGNVENGKILDSIGNAPYELIGNSLNNKLWGGKGGDVLRGGFGNDEFHGNDDALNSGSDADPHTYQSAPDDFYGGLGNDVYYLYEAAISNYGYSIIHENPDEGIDTVRVLAAFNGSFLVNDYTMADNVEIGIIDDAGGFRLTGNDLANDMTGNSGNDGLLGGGGADMLRGGAGYDGLVGGEGGDTYYLYDVSVTSNDDPEHLVYSFDEVIEDGEDDATDIVHIRAAGHPDFALAVETEYSLTTNIEEVYVDSSIGMILFGNLIGNAMFGNAGSDQLYGLEGRDTLRGGGGRDTLDGGENQDILFGGADKDSLIGGDDHDTFAFNSVSESRAGVRYRDVIVDFTQGNVETRDLIDLSAIDANTHKHGNQAFDFIGGRAFGSHGDQHVYGQLRVETLHTFDGDVSLLQADVNGDGKADFEIEFLSVIEFSDLDFKL